MKKQFLRARSRKTRIAIRIDDDVLQWSRGQVHKAGGGSYQTLINDALRRFAESAESDLEDTLGHSFPVYKRFGTCSRGLTRCFLKRSP